MAEWKPIEIPHSSSVVAGRRVPFWQRPDWSSTSDRVWIAIAPLLVLGAMGWIILQFRHGHSDDDSFGLGGFALALLAIAVGVGILYANFIANRELEAPCPACGAKQRWTPGRREECNTCSATMLVGADATVRELSLDEVGRFSLFVDIEFENAVAEDGHVTLVMPDMCAVCGAQPTTTVLLKDKEEPPEDPVDLVRAKDLAALAVPLCAQHADQAPITLEGRSAYMTFTSYRYFRAFHLANAHVKAPEQVKRVAAVPRPQATPGQLEPLTCDNCGAPLAVSEGDETTCAACGHTATLPEPYRLLRDAKRMSEQDATQLQELAADIAQPPPAWKRVAMIIGYIVGGVTLAVMALGSIIGAIIGALAGSEVGESIATVLAIVLAVGFGIVSIPYVGEWVVGLAMLHHTDLATNLVSSGSPVYRYDVIAGAVLYGLGVVPIALAYRTQGNLKSVVELQGKLAAQPSTVAGGGVCCRHCGAALEVARGAIVSRCLYCGAENLLTVPAAVATAHRDEAKQLDVGVQGAIAQHARERDDDRAITAFLLVGGLLLVPFVCGAGFLLHRLFLG